MVKKFSGERLKICLFGDIAAPHLRRWAVYFFNRGHQVDIITLNEMEADDYGGANIHIVKKKFSGGGAAARMINFLPTLQEIKKILKRIRPDLIHGQDAGGNSWLAALSGFHPLVVTPWGSDILIHTKEDFISGFFTKYALKKADLILCDGVNIRDEMIKMGISNSKIKIFAFGVDVEKFKPALKESKRRKIIISTRFLTAVHDVETLVRAVPLVVKDFPEVKFIIIGDGNKKFFLERLACGEGAGEFIEFVGRVTEAQMAQYLRSSDIYVSTSLSESGLAASTAEAMACELPVINTDTGDIRSWIQDGKGGFVIPVKNPNILAEKLIYLLKNDSRRLAFGKNNRKIIEEKNNYRKEMADVEIIYKSIIKGYAI